MSEDATLDTFAGSGDTDGGDGDEEPSPDGVDEEPRPPASDDEPAEQPAPPTLTYTSSPDGDACDECGETVQNRWRAGEGAEDPDALVCPDCKTW